MVAVETCERPLWGFPLKKRVFSREFKLDVVRQLVSGQKRLAQLCWEHDLCETLLRRWREQSERDGEHAWLHPGAGEAPLRDAEARIAQLEAALGRATLEIDFLRHALKVAQEGGSISPRNGHGSRRRTGAFPTCRWHAPAPCWR